MKSQSWIWLSLLFLLAGYAILNPWKVEAVTSDPVAVGPVAVDGGGNALRFWGNGAGDIDRVKIPIDNPENDAAGPPADVGATDFTIEFWLKALRAENSAAAVTCGAGVEWINGNIIIDRDRYNQERKFGLSLADGRLVWGVSGDDGELTICGTTDLLDGQWHHVAVQRRLADGEMWIFVDGKEDATGNGPDGDVSYPDDGVPADFCGGPCTNSDPFLVIGAEKHDAGPAYPSYSGWLDELRLSTVLRYTANFTRPLSPFVPDANTAALYHFDEDTFDAADFGFGGGSVTPLRVRAETDTILDSSGAVGGPSNGTRKFGGDPAGPLRMLSDAPLNGPLFYKTRLPVILP